MTKTAALRALHTALTLASLSAGLLAAAAAPAAAQDVGYTPEASPFRDLPYRQELTFFGGYFLAARDPAGVAPTSGPMAGARYEIRIGGPAQFYARTAVAMSERDVVNPRLAPGARELGSESVTLGLADVGISLNLTGQRSWRGIVPVVSGGAGIATDFASPDVGGFRLGTPFAITLGAGVRWTSGGNWQVRADVTDYLYQVKYPPLYFQAPAPNVDPVLPPNSKQSVWKHNAALTLGVSYLFFR